MRSTGPLVTRPGLHLFSVTLGSGSRVVSGCGVGEEWDQD